MSRRFERKGSSDSRASARMERSSSGERRSSASGSSDSSRLRDESQLPAAFGRVSVTAEETDLDLIQRMSKSFINAPLGTLTRCIDGERKIKIWTRDFKKVRGICTGYLIAFDKHWNLVLSDVEEAFMKPKRNKTPFLDDLESARKFAELPPKTVKPKKKPKETQEELPAVKPETGEKKGKKKKRKKKKCIPLNRHVKQLFVRGDNIVMVSVLPNED